MATADPDPGSPERDPEARERAARFAACIRAVATSGDRAAFEALYLYFAPRIKAYMRRVERSDAAAEELAQETMLQVWRKSALFDPARAGASTWIFTIARNLRIDRLRREIRPEFDPSDPLLVPEPAEDADVQLSREEEAVQVRRALDQLQPEQARLVKLSFFEGQSHAEIARSVGLPLGTVKSRIRLAVAKIRQALKEP